MTADSRHGDLPLSLRVRIDAICDRFEAAWQVGDRPRITDYTADAGPTERRALAWELVKVDLAYRRRAGESPEASDYAGLPSDIAPDDLAELMAAGVDTGAVTIGPNDEPRDLPPLGAAGRSSGQSPGSHNPAVTIDQADRPHPHELPSPPPGYEIMGELGRGGMGVVYHARQTRLNRAVALKVILTGAHATATERVRFLAEAEAVAALSHPGILQVYECGTHQGQPYLALEFCRGGSLADKLRGTPLPPRDAAALVEQIARAVQAAHDRGIIHRDLKPANILLQRDDAARTKNESTSFGSSFILDASSYRPKVGDFGLAKRVEGSGALTATGVIVGTPSYMAPEQAAGDGRPVGPAADVYALGAILYECLTGRPPFKAATPMETVNQLKECGAPPVRTLNPQVPVDLETVCHKCLQKEPQRRYVSAHDIGDDLQRFLDGQPVVARPIGTMERAAAVLGATGHWLQQLGL